MNTTITCPNCGESFQPKRSSAIYCSASCKQTVYKKRRAAHIEALNNGPTNNVVEPQQQSTTPATDENAGSKRSLSVSEEGFNVNKIDAKQGDTVNYREFTVNSVNETDVKGLTVSNPVPAATVKGVTLRLTTSCM